MPAHGMALVRNAQRRLLKVVGDFQVERLAAYKKRKVIHDPIWGTCTYEPWEASLLELGVFQRLRGLRQTGFAYLTYPTAEHSRFQHTLGVMEASSRIFDSIVRRLSDEGLSRTGLIERRKSRVFRRNARNVTRWRVLLRLAALVHDTGHSIFSHSSERIYKLIDPLPGLIAALKSENSKAPGAAEVIVYLVVTSPEWRRAVNALWKRSTKSPLPPSAAEWERIGRWIMGQEEERDLKFLADIISGPLDADKLDYVFRDGYAAGIPVGYDLDRLIATVCVDPQEAADGRAKWWRLTLPVRGINALEQLVMGRLVLNSYLYHHHKCRAAETAFERALAREYISTKRILGRRNVWELFLLQDADAYAHRLGPSRPAREIKDLYERRLRVRIVEFRRTDIPERSQRAAAGFVRLLEFSSLKSWAHYQELISLENRIARKAGLPAGAVFIDIPKNPDYADLENLLLPGRTSAPGEPPSRVLNYRDWIEAYKIHRAFIRVFGPRGIKEEASVWRAAVEVLGAFGLALPASARVAH